MGPDDETIVGYGKLSGIKSQIETYAEESSSSDNKNETQENAVTDENAGTVSGSSIGLKKSAPDAKKSEAEALAAQADEPSAQAENATIEEVNFDKYTGARTYQAYFERRTYEDPF